MISSLETHLDYSWSSNDCVIRHSLVASCQDDIVLSCDPTRHFHRKAALYLNRNDENRPRSSDESAVQSGRVISRLKGVTGGIERYGPSRVNISTGAKHQLGESFERELWTWGWARNDERRCQRVHLIRIERDIKRGGKWSFTQSSTNISVVACLDGEDGARSCQISSVDDIGGGTKIGRDSNACIRYQRSRWGKVGRG